MDLSIIAQHFDDIAKIIGGVLAIAGIVWSILKWVIPTYKSVKRSFAQMEKIASISDIVLAEFRPNGGSSMKDSITRIDNNLSMVRSDAMRMEARQWAIVASLPDPVFETSATGEYIRVNSAYLHLTGRTVADVTGNGWEITVHPEDRAKVWQEWHDAVKRLRAYEGTFRMIDSDGALFSVRCIAHPYKNPADESVLGYLGRIIDIKELAPPPKKA